MCRIAGWERNSPLSCALRASTPDVEALRAHVRGRLAAPKAPRYWVFLAEFPLTGSGKIQKFVLRERWNAGAFAVIDAVGDRPARS